MPDSQPSAPSDPLTAVPAPDAGAAQRGKAIALMLLGVGLFSIMDAIIKWLGPGYPTVQLIFFRSVCAFLPLAFIVFRGGIGNALRVKDPVSHVLRSLVGLIALSCFFYAFARMPLAEVVAITFAAPVFVTALSVPLLGERVGPRRWTAVLVGFLGVLIMVRPGAAVFETIALVPLGGVVFYALAMILVRKLSRTETSASIVFYFTVTTTVVSGALLPFSWVMPDGLDWALLASLGLIGGCAQIAFTRAVALADVAVIMPFEYSAMIWAAALGFFIWGELPGFAVWLGAAIVIASGLYILFRESALQLPRGKARRLQPKR